MVLSRVSSIPHFCTRHDRCAATGRTSADRTRSYRGHTSYTPPDIWAKKHVGLTNSRNQAHKGGGQTQPELTCAAAACASVLEARRPHSNYFHTHTAFIPIHADPFSSLHPRLSSSLFSVQLYTHSTYITSAQLTARNAWRIHPTHYVSHPIEGIDHP